MCSSNPRLILSGRMLFVNFLDCIFECVSWNNIVTVNLQSIPIQTVKFHQCFNCFKILDKYLEQFFLYKFFAFSTNDLSKEMLQENMADAFAHGHYNLKKTTNS